MRRVLRRAAGALLAAGALGLARPAAAQPMRPLPPLLPAPNSAPAVEVRPAAPPADPARDRDEEMRVELAWMADATTFAYAFSARAADGSLEVRGFAPNEAVKQKALEIARAHTGLAVEDGVKLMPKLAVRAAAGVPVEELQRGAAVLLADALGDRATNYHVQARIDGQVTLSGAAASLKDKWTASRCMRQLPGCTCVVNELTAARAAPPPHHHAPAAQPEAAPPSPPDDALPPPRVAPPPSHTAAPSAVKPAAAAAPPAPSTAVKPAATAAPRPDPASADVLVAPDLPPAWSAPPKKAAKPAKKVEFASDAPAAKPAAARPPADDRQPIMTTGVAYFEDADLPEPPAPTLPPAALRLKGRVEAACGGKAREVQVVVTADGMHVHVILTPGASHDEVARRVLQLPDMKAPGVQLNVEVAP